MNPRGLAHAYIAALSGEEQQLDRRAERRGFCVENIPKNPNFRFAQHTVAGFRRWWSSGVAARVARQAIEPWQRPTIERRQLGQHVSRDHRRGLGDIVDEAGNFGARDRVGKPIAEMRQDMPIEYPFDFLDRTAFGLEFKTSRRTFGKR